MAGAAGDSGNVVSPGQVIRVIAPGQYWFVFLFSLLLEHINTHICANTHIQGHTDGLTHSETKRRMHKQTHPTHYPSLVQPNPVKIRTCFESMSHHLPLHPDLLGRVEVWVSNFCHRVF